VLPAFWSRRPLFGRRASARRSLWARRRRDCCSSLSESPDYRTGKPRCFHMGLFGLTNWGTKPLVSFPQKFYCGTYQIELDLSAHPEVAHLRTQWKVSRWGRGAPEPLFGFYLFAQETVGPSRPRGPHEAGSRGCSTGHPASMKLVRAGYTAVFVVLFLAVLAYTNSPTCRSSRPGCCWFLPFCCCGR